MDGRFTEREMERVLARAIELDTLDGRAADGATLVRLAAELGIREESMRRALAEHRLPGSRPTLIDRILGPPQVAAAAAGTVAQTEATGIIERFMYRQRLTPATTPGTWLQQRGSWPNPYAANSVPTVQASVRESPAGTSIVMTADLEDARIGYVGGSFVAVLTGVLMAIVLPGWAAAVSLGAAVVTFLGLRSSYRTQVTATSGALRTALDDLQLPFHGRASRRAGLASNDSTGVLQERFAFEDASRTQASEF